MKETLYVSGFTVVNRSLPHLICPALGVRHGFSTRLGGVSRESGLESLDLGANAGMPEVTENRRRFAASLGVTPERTFIATQIHSAKVETVTETDLGRAFDCDGFVTDQKGLLLTAKAADCVPILFADKRHHVIAAVHAGWRGTVAGIVSEAIKSMTALGAAPHNIVAAIGPCIHRECYEVDEPFLSAVKEKNKDLSAFVAPHPEKHGRYLADLVAMNRFLLRQAGLKKENIYATDFCTVCENDLFFSHRAGGGKRGLLMAGILL